MCPEPHTEPGVSTKEKEAAGDTIRIFELRSVRTGCLRESFLKRQVRAGINNKLDRGVRAAETEAQVRPGRGVGVGSPKAEACLGSSAACSPHGAVKERGKQAQREQPPGNSGRWIPSTGGSSAHPPPPKSPEDVTNQKLGSYRTMWLMEGGTGVQRRSPNGVRKARDPRNGSPRRCL